MFYDQFFAMMNEDTQKACLKILNSKCNIKSKFDLIMDKRYRSNSRYRNIKFILHWAIISDCIIKIVDLLISQYFYDFHSGGQGWIRTIVLKWEQISYYYSFHYQIKFVCSLDFLFIFFKIPGIKSLHSEFLPSSGLSSAYTVKTSPN